MASLLLRRLAATLLILLSIEVVRGDEFDRVRELIRKGMAEQHVPGMSVAVAVGGRVVWAEGFGWADVQRRIPADENTVYSVASVTKPITATALMVLVERGEIDLQRPVNSYLGSTKLKAFQGHADEATVIRVATHMAGLPEHYHFFYSDESKRPPSMDETIRRYGIVVARPGERFLYSNLGYGILGFLISRVSRNSLGNVLQNEVFRPLGMTTAQLGVTAGCEQCATRYGDNGAPLPAYDFDHPGASAAWASVHDLILFGLFHAGTPLPEQHRILSDADRSRMQQEPADQVRGYGIGWNVWHHPYGYTVIYHGGNMPGASADLTIIPEKQIVVVVAANRSSSLPYRINDEIIYKTLLPVAETQSSAPTNPQNIAQAAPSKKTVSSELIGRWAGAVHTYEGRRRLSIDVSNDGEVQVTLDGKKATLNKTGLENGLHGEFSGNLSMSDARADSLLVLSLTRQSKKLAGVVTAYSPPGVRVEYGLTQWVEVSKLRGLQPRRTEGDSKSAPFNRH